MKLTSWRRGAVTLLALGALSTPALAARDMCKLLKDKGILDDLEFNECKAAQEKEDAAVETKTKDVLGMKLPSWVSVFTPFGDVRTRGEGFYGNDYHAETRFRLRARFGMTANVSDEISGTVRLATGDANDPLSTNQTFTNTFTRKPVNFDWGYLTLKPGKTFGLQPGWGQVVLGKFGVNNVARESELLWDDDLAPEGASETLNLIDNKEGFWRGLRLNGVQWVMSEVAANNDAWIAGGQAVLDTAVGSTATWSTSIADYDFIGMNQIARTYLSPFNDPAGTKANNSFNSSLSNSNDVVTKGSQITGYKSGFNIINIGSELNFPSPFGLGIPAGVFGDLAHNTQASGRNTGVVVGVGIGKAGKDWYHDSLKNPGDWGITYEWEYVEKNAVVSLFSYDDMRYQQLKTTQKGSTNITGSILRLDYELFSNFQLTAKSHFINALDREIATTTNGKALAGNPTLTRIQVDAVLKF